jgi:hypothetical protein
VNLFRYTYPTSIPAPGMVGVPNRRVKLFRYTYPTASART